MKAGIVVVVGMYVFAVLKIAYKIAVVVLAIVGAFYAINCLI